MSYFLVRQVCFGEKALNSTESTRRSVAARAPTRIDLGGGWTDVPPYCEREGGFVCNFAIDRYAVTRVSASDQSRVSGVEASGAPMVRAAMRRAGVSGGVSVTMQTNFPVAAGLGGSSATSAALLGALAEWTGSHWGKSEIAEEGRRIEVVDLGVAGGRQDHYAATHGGALALRFTDTVELRRLEISVETRAELLRRSLLIYTGQSRVSASTITSVLGAYEAGDKRVVGPLARMRELAEQMADVLESGDLDGLGDLLAEHWTYQRSLHESIPTERIDEIIARGARAGALGAKATGASGGGCVYLLCAAGKTESVRDEIQELGEMLTFGFDDAGLTILES
jgi:D-glycero-alpha-D-manno-heptose-7-phosphate kinase